MPAYRYSKLNIFTNNAEKLLKQFGGVTRGGGVEKIDTLYYWKIDV